MGKDVTILAPPAVSGVRDEEGSKTVWVELAPPARPAGR